MLFKRHILDAIEKGEVTLAFRRWTRPTVKPGGTLRTAIGVLAIEAVDVVDLGKIGPAEARQAGYASREELLAELASRKEGKVYRIRLRLEGADPRIALRKKRRLTKAEREAIEARLARMDKASRHGPWTRTYLALIGRHPGTRAADLAARAGRETQAFKAEVRRLKELGLTESLETGYRLSPLGQAFLLVFDRDLS